MQNNIYMVDKKPTKEKTVEEQKSTGEEPVEKVKLEEVKEEHPVETTAFLPEVKGDLEQEPEEKSEADAELSDGIFELEPEESSGSKTKIAMAVVGLLIIAGLAVGGYFLYNLRKEKPSKETIQTEKPQESTSTSDTKKEESTATKSAKKQEKINLADYSVQILNGSGIAGEAGVVKDLLKDKGFENFETGNADSYDYTDTEVSLKADISSEVFDSIKGSLESYSVIVGDELAKDSTFDIVVVVGQKVE